MKNILKLFLIFLVIFSCTITIYGKENKKYVYIMKKFGIFRYPSGNSSKEEVYLKIGMKKSELSKLNDIKTLSTFNLEFEGDRIKNIWITSNNVKTPDGYRIGSSIGEFKRYQPVNIGGSLQAYTPPFSGVVFASNTRAELIDLILISSPSISSDFYRNNKKGYSSRYVKNGRGKPAESVIDGIITDLYRNLNMSPSFLQDVILLPSRERLGNLYALYGGQNIPVTSFCVNDRDGSVIYGCEQMSYGILAHEYAHVWYFQYIGHNAIDPVIMEGFAEWVRYHYEGKFFKEEKEKDYKKGLKLFLDIEKKNGTDGVFNYILKKG